MNNMFAQPVQHVLRQTAYNQQPSTVTSSITLNSTEISCPLIWDSKDAKFSTCALPYLAAFPALFVVLFAVLRLLRSQIERWRPGWTRPFVVEYAAEPIFQGGKSRNSGCSIALLLISSIGFLAQLVQLAFLPTDSTTLILLSSWAGVVVLVAIERPRACPTSLLTFFLSASALHFLIKFTNGSHPLGIKDATTILSFCSAMAGATVILLMPLRDPSLLSVNISAVGEVPNNEKRSPEDNLRLWQFLSISWLSPLLRIGKKRTLNEEDVWLLAFEFQHKRLHEAFRQLRGSVVRRVFRANCIDLLIVAITSGADILCEFSNPLLLQQFLKAMENPLAPKRVALTYAVLMLMLRVINAQLDVLTMWYGRRCYERARGEMTMMVYEKALSRKNIIVHEEEEEEGKEVVTDESSKPATDGSRNGHATGPNAAANGLNETTNADSNSRTTKPTSPVSSRYATFLRKFWKETKPIKLDVKAPASMGKILNLIRGDVYEVAQRFWELDSLIRQPLGLVLGVLLIWKLLGPSCFIGVVVVILAQIMNAFITRILLRWERRKRIARDKRLNLTSQFVEALRHLRWYGWQDHWLKQTMEARQHELFLKVATELWSLLITIFNSLGSNMLPVFALYAYTVIAGHTLSIDIIFPALSLFSKLDFSLQEIPALVTSFLNAYIAVGRLEDFMSESNRDENEFDATVEPSSIELKSCDFAWPGTTVPVLQNLDLTFSKGMSVIVGKVGSGKTALLQAILGELDKISGTSRIPDEMIGYCAQSPWLQSMSVRENILFSAPYEEHRYMEVLNACALLPDFEGFKHGDQSFIGENGIGLSGGQRARVALARAVYSRANIMLLDDPLSALDYNTAESIVRNCFGGSLMKDRTIVLVTHRIELVKHMASQIIEISDGRATILNSDLVTETGPSNETATRQVPDAELKKDQDTEGTLDKFMEDEHRAEWGVQGRVYWKFIRAGKLKWWSLLVVVLMIFRSLRIAESWFLKVWGEAYSEPSQMFILSSGNRDLFISELIPSPSGFIKAMHWTPLKLFDSYPPPQDDVKPWLVAFLIISTLQVIAFPSVILVNIVIDYCASRTLFMQVMVCVSRATFRWYDVTPVGRLMNRLTSDIGTIDGSISTRFLNITFQSLIWLSSIVIIASVTPSFLIFSLALSGAFVLIFMHFLPTSQSLRRLEMVSLSPLMSNFGELLHGLTTVRAFHAEHRFQERVISVVDKFQGMDHFYWSMQNWLMYRYDNLAAMSTFLLTAFALYTDVTPGLTAFVLVAASNFMASTRFLCRQYGNLQMDFVSVERIDELLHIDQEAIGSVNPPASWPAYGSSIIFQHVTIRYAPHLEPSLADISLEIPGGSTTAIVGRTGSGKSTLAISLLNVVRPETGSIFIDNLNITDVDNEMLRSRVTFVAQDPVLFAGTIRLNLDPTETYSDEVCSSVLERLCGRHNWTLKTQIEAGGRNLSQGQRQLIGLTRAVLRRSPIVILDEATASIDYESSMEIQQILREEMVEATVIMIAHRVEAVRGADYAIMLDKGRVVRQGPVSEMLDVGEDLIEG